jgi:CheY-like chemotaxis protein
MSRVLVVEDEPDIRLLCRLVLEGGGHDVLEAATAEIALEVLGTALADFMPLDFMLLDIRLPGMGGWDMLVHVQDDTRLRRLKVVICSANAGPADRLRAEADGAYGFLAKPFLPEHLLGLFEPAPGPTAEIIPARLPG